MPERGPKHSHHDHPAGKSAPREPGAEDIQRPEQSIRLPLRRSRDGRTEPQSRRLQPMGMHRHRRQQVRATEPLKSPECTYAGAGLSGKREAPPLMLRPLWGVLCTVAFPTPVNATTDERNDDMKPTRSTNEAELKALFEHAVRAIGFYEAQRKEALMALESLPAGAEQPPSETADAIGASDTSRPGYAPGRLSFWMSNSPQTRHKPMRSNSENGGFLRVTEDRYFVAKALIFTVLRE